MKSSNKKELSGAALESRRRKVEATATFGLVLIAVAMLCPFFNLNGGGTTWFNVYKWIYAAGALIFTTSRLVSVNDPKDSLRLRRLRRLEFWAGMAFCIGAFFWFYNEQKFATVLYAGPLAILRDTVMFSLAGAVIQVIASWMVSFRQSKEAKGRGEGGQQKKADKKVRHNSAPKADQKIDEKADEKK